MSPEDEADLVIKDIEEADALGNFSICMTWELKSSVKELVLDMCVCTISTIQVTYNGHERIVSFIEW